MLGKEIVLDKKIPETVEDKAKRIIAKIHKSIVDREEEVTEAKDKLAEVLEKDVKDIKEKDGNHWDW